MSFDCQLFEQLSHYSVAVRFGPKPRSCFFFVRVLPTNTTLPISVYSGVAQDCLKLSGGAEVRREIAE
jgi:hypothetical protein